MICIPYHSDSERNEILDTKIKEGLYLIEEQNIAEGNFLIFDNQPLSLPTDTVQYIPLSMRIEILEDALLTLMFGGVA